MKLANTKLTDQLLGSSLMFANKRLNRAIATSVEGLELNFDQAFILYELGFTAKCAPINQKQLSNTLRLQQHNVSRNLSKLQNKGLIVRQQKDGFKREKVVQLTPDGELVAEKVTEIILSQRELAFAHIEIEDRARLITVIQAIMK